ncbi:10142_t:CDS:2, partial [Gigaspora rosea]
NGIYKSVISFLKKLETNNITEKNRIEEFQDSKETEENTEVYEFIQERDVLKLQNALENVDKY